MPRARSAADVVAVVAESPITGRPGLVAGAVEVVEVGGRAGCRPVAVVVVAGRRPRARLEGAPGGVVAAELGSGAGLVGVVADREHVARDSGDERCRVVSCVRVQLAMSPAPTSTGSDPAALTVTVIVSQSEAVPSDDADVEGREPHLAGGRRPGEVGPRS